MLKFICHPRCTTCKKAEAYLKDAGFEFEKRDIAENNPTRDELEKWLAVSGRDIKKAFNTSGIQYRALGMKERLKDMSADEALELLASDGMLVKRPVLVGEDFVLFGFKEAEWAENLNK